VRLNDGTTIDLTGESFGFLTVVEHAPNDAFGRVYWRCICRCGAPKLKAAHQLRTGKFFTCGSVVCRFWEKVYIPEGDSCHEWTGSLNDQLLPGTHQNNMDDMVEHGRSSSPRPPVSAVVKAAMRRDHEDGLSYVGLVEKYGVSYATVNRTLQAARVSARKD
jgi:hypothetical protein